MGTHNLERREFLRVAATAPLALSGLQAFGNIDAAQRETRTPLIILWLSGGISGKEFVNPDPASAPPELRGPLGSTRTPTPGIHFSESWPKLAERQRKFVTLRALDAGTSDHIPGAEHAVRHGSKTISEQIGDRAGSGVPYVFLNPGATWPAIDSAFQRNNSFSPLWNAQQKRFSPPVLAENTNLAQRRRLLDSFDTGAIETPVSRRMHRFRETAFDLMQGGGQFFRALDLPEREKARYGNSLSGDMILTAKQFIERGAGAVTIYHEPESQAWDMHGGLQNKMRIMAPEMDHAASTLIDEIDSHRLNAVLLMMGEIPRTPRMNSGGGRDHFQLGNTAILAGGRFAKGVVHGKTSSHGTILEGGVQQRGELGNTVLAACGEELSPNLPKARSILSL